MARKKKLKEVESESEAYLDEVDLLRYNYTQERLESLGQKITLKMYEAMELRRNADIRAGQLQSELAALKAARSDVVPELAALQDQLRKKYGMDFEVDTYDDVTGLIIKGVSAEDEE